MSARRGLTLLELLLALAISALVLTALGMAIDLQLRVVEAGRADVEQAQLARALLRRIGDDLRGTVRYAPIDVNALVASTGTAAAAGAAASAAGSQAASGGGTSGGSAGGGSAGGGSAGGGSAGGGSAGSGSTGGRSAGSGSTGGRSTSGSGTSSAGGTSGVTQAGTASAVKSISGGTTSPTSAGSNTAGSGGAAGGGMTGAAGGSTAGTAGGGTSTTPGTQTENNTDVATSSVVPVTPGLYGNPFELQVDVSRLPRIDQYQQLVATPDGTPADRVSDVKTVAYYVVPPTTGVTPGRGSGLVRRTLDRAATAWATTQGGGASDLVRHVEVLAPEATAIEFRYFDGTEWTDAWDSAERNGTPVAIEVALKLASVRPATRASFFSLGSDGGQAVEERIYRLVVHLPTAQPTTLNATAATSTSTETTP